ncbi:MAG: hypothetical protein MJY62_03780 [Bacteroidales bacterium]|nr:hypothetical protein [Bacteroidales bacterium]
MVLTVFSTLSLHFQTAGGKSWTSSLSESLFEVVSYITTCGFAVTDNSAWPPVACAALLMASFQCGCAGSTSGGLKADRMLIAFKALRLQIGKQVNPNAVRQVRIGGRIISNGLVRSVMAFTILYILITVVSTLLLLFVNVPVDEAITGSLASISNVGPGLGRIGCAGNYSHCIPVAKVIYSLEMIFGRLEIYPLLSFIAIIFNRNRR